MVIYQSVSFCNRMSFYMCKYCLGCGLKAEGTSLWFFLFLFCGNSPATYSKYFAACKCFFFSL